IGTKKAWLTGATADPSSRGAARSLRRAATWRSQACAPRPCPSRHREERPGVCEGLRRGDLKIARSNSQIATLRSQ
ncbi:MAG TPA: hypothetical protein PLY86_16310, partial [bacterium]|nr:hypothetical protein [bacterium]